MVLLVVDVTVGVTDEDMAVARLLKRSGRPVLVVVNKVDSSQREVRRLGRRGPRARVTRGR